MTTRPKEPKVSRYFQVSLTLIQNKHLLTMLNTFTGKPILYMIASFRAINVENNKKGNASNPSIIDNVNHRILFYEITKRLQDGLFRIDNFEQITLTNYLVKGLLCHDCGQLIFEGDIKQDSKICKLCSQGIETPIKEQIYNYISK